MAKQPATPEADRGLPYQMDVYFQSYPALDYAALARFVNGCEAGGEPCEVQQVGEDKTNEEGRRIGSFLASVQPMMIATLVHNWPSPADLIEHSSLPKPAKDRLAAHGAFALLTQLGGEQSVVPCA